MKRSFVNDDEDDEKRKGWNDESSFDTGLLSHISQLKKQKRGSHSNDHEEAREDGPSTRSTKRHEFVAVSEDVLSQYSAPFKAIVPKRKIVEVFSDDEEEVPQRKEEEEDGGEAEAVPEQMVNFEEEEERQQLEDEEEEAEEEEEMDRGTPPPTPDSFNPKLMEAEAAFGVAKDDPLRCPLCRLGFGSKHSNEYAAVVRLILNLNDMASNQNHVRRAKEITDNYTNLLMKPMNKTIHNNIQKKPENKKIILKNTPLFPKLTCKQAWFHYNRPHVKNNENYMILEIEHLNLMKELVFNQLMVKNAEGVPGLNAESVDLYLKLSKQEQSLRSKQPLNPMFSSNPASVAICATALSSGVQTTVMISANKSTNVGLLDL
jgi:hypothetical protein